MLIRGLIPPLRSLLLDPTDNREIRIFPYSCLSVFIRGLIPPLCFLRSLLLIPGIFVLTRGVRCWMFNVQCSMFPEVLPFVPFC